MKSIKRLLVRYIFVVSIFSIVSIALSISGAGIINNANAAVSEFEVRIYLNERDYNIVSLELLSEGPRTKNSVSWLAHTIKNGEHLWTTVYCSASEVIGHGDSPF